LLPSGHRAGRQAKLGIPASKKICALFRSEEHFGALLLTTDIISGKKHALTNNRRLSL
jgi:hypothetical protein